VPAGGWEAFSVDIARGVRPAVPVGPGAGAAAGGLVFLPAPPGQAEQRSAGPALSPGGFLGLALARLRRLRRRPPPGHRHGPSPGHGPLGAGPREAAPAHLLPLLAYFGKDMGFSTVSFEKNFSDRKKICCIWAKMG
jgi:hypothetical protein